METIDALVIDGHGLLGQALLQVLEKRGWSTQGSDPKDTAKIQTILQELKPRVVFLTSDGSSTSGTHLQVAEASRRCGAQLVFYSSDSVFDGINGPYSEEDPIHPASASGEELVKTEREIRNLLPEQNLILRTSMLFGWDRKSRNLAMETWERLQSGNPWQVPSEQWGNPTYVEYLAEVSARLAQMEVRGTIHVSGKDWMAKSDLAKAIAQSMGLPSNLVIPVPVDPFKGGLKTDRLRKLLGTEPLDLQESLKRFRRQWRADTHVTYRPPAASEEAEKLKKEIFERVQKYHELVHKPRPFVPLKSRIPYAGRVFGSEEMIKLVDSSLEFWLTLGPYGEEFEQRMRIFFGAKDFLLANSGSTANLLAVMTLTSPQLKNPLQSGDEVITSAVGFPTTLAPIVQCGLTPVLVDAEVGTYNIRPGLIEKAISPKTKAIMVAHTLGIPCDMDLITQLAKKHGLYLVEDCCDALGGTFQNQKVGTFGDLATLSFYPAHQITMGEGGGLVVNRMALSRTARSIRDWGRDCWCAPGESNTCGKRFGWQLGELPKGYDHKYSYSNIGFNFKPTDMQAAIGVAQLDRLEQFIEKRRRNFDRLYQGLLDYQDRIILPTRDPRSNPCWFGFPITVRANVSRDAMVQWLENAGIETRDIFGGNLLRQPAFQKIKARVPGETPEADRIMRDTFFIGVYPGLTDEMIAFMLETIHAFFARNRNEKK